MDAEGYSKYNFAPARAFCDGLVSHLQWNNLDIIYDGGNMEAGAIFKKTDQLKAAQTSGRAIF